MRRVKDALRRVTTARGVPTARHVAERAVAPYLRADVHSIHGGLVATVDRVADLEQAVARLSGELAGVRVATADLEQHMPSVLNAIVSTNGTTRLLRRELEQLRREVLGLGDQLAAAPDSDDIQREMTSVRREIASELLTVIAQESAARIGAEQSIRDDMSPHIDTVAWLLRRVELIRTEVLNEVRYGDQRDETIETHIVNPAALEPADGLLRLNLGSGHIPLEGFANVDMRPLPGVDVVASVDNLPAQPATVEEIFSAHTLEHFPEEKLRRSLLPYWFGLLKPGGTIRAVVPDLEAMSHAYVAGNMTFDVLRGVTYGGQEYEGDFHFTGFTPASIAQLFTAAGFVQAKVIARGRPNGDCLECEVSAVRPAS